MSQINTNGINTNFPVPGTNNSTQPFRDNFTQITTQLNTAAAEITDLQSKSVLKAALNNIPLNNDMGNTLISNAATSGFRSTTYNLGNALAGTVLVNVNQADVQFGAVTGNIALQFGGWSPTNTESNVVLRLTMTDPTATISLPRACVSSNNNYGVTLLENYANISNVATLTAPADAGILEFRFSSLDCGNTITVTPINRPFQSTEIQQRTPSPVGFPGDVPGTVAVDADYMYVCTADFNANVVQKDVTIATSDNHLNCGTTSNLFVNNPIVFSGNVFGGVAANTVYYIKTIPDSANITISASGFNGEAGSVFALTAGQGNMVATTYNNGSQIWKLLELNSLLGSNNRIYSGESNVSIPNPNSNIYLNANAGVDYQWVFDTTGAMTLATYEDSNTTQNNAVITANAGTIINIVNGNTTSYSKISLSDATSGNVTISTNGNTASSNPWVFDSTGNLTLPANTFAVNYRNGSPVTFDNLSNGFSNISIPVANGNVYINANSGTDNQWNFDTTGNLTTPGGTVLDNTGNITSNANIGVDAANALTLSSYTSNVDVRTTTIYQVVINYDSINYGTAPTGYPVGISTNVATTASGAGTGLTVDIAVQNAGGPIGFVRINNQGSGYTTGETITIPKVGGASGTAASFTITVETNHQNDWTFDNTGNLTTPGNILIPADSYLTTVGGRMRIALDTGNSNINFSPDVLSPGPGSNVLQITSGKININGDAYVSNSFLGNGLYGNAGNLTIGINAPSSTNHDINIIPSGTGNLNIYNNSGNANLTVTGTTSSNSFVATGGTANFSNSTAVNLGPVGNVAIAGGASGQYLQTNGSGGLTWAAVPVGSGISNGTSNINIPAVNGNINFSSNAVANVLVVAGTGVFSNGNMQVNGNVIANTGSYFVGDGSRLANITGANVAGIVPTANYSSYAGNLVGSLPGANVSGQVAFANVANSVAGGNVSGTVANASYALEAGHANTADSAVNGVPTGAIFWLAAQNAPTGYLVCGGQSYAKTDYPGLFDVIGYIYTSNPGGPDFNVPNLQGQFIRGYDSTNQVDPGRQFGSKQLDAMQNHAHNFSVTTANNSGVYANMASGGDNAIYQNPTSPGNTQPVTSSPVPPSGSNVAIRTATETRPTNIALLPVIKF